MLIHAAANTNVEQCEVDPEACYRDNLLLSELVAQAAAIAGVRVVYVSSTGVYGSHETTPYSEYSRVLPTTHHHRAKLLGEEAVLRQGPRNLIIRTGWLFGGRLDNPKNFVARRVEEMRLALANGTTVSSNSQQRGVPTSTADVARRTLALVEAECAGVFNCVNSGAASRLEYVEAIAEAVGLPVSIVPTNAAAFNRKARVSDNETAVNWRMNAIGFAPMPEWRDSLARYIEASGLRAT